MSNILNIPRRGSIALSLFERFSLLYIPEPNSGCWLWFGATDEDGYGKISRGGKRKANYISAHRVSHEFFKGPIPKGMNVLHSCDMPCCVNPDHLRAGTNQDNVQDRVARGRTPKGEDHGCAKLTEPEVLSIRADTRSNKQIAKDYNVTRTLIYLIKNRKLWKYL